MKRKLIAMLFLAVHVTGCHSWRTATITPAQLNADEPPPTALLTLKDGTRVRFNEPTIRNDSINGVAFSDVSTITTTARRYSAAKTTLGLVVLGMPVGLAVIIGLGCQSDCF